MRPRSKIVGVGTNDADYQTQAKGARCLVYQKWKIMLERCYDPYRLNGHGASYRDCEVSPEWLLFSNFKKWYDKQGDTTGKFLDKDILQPGNRVYGVDYCMYVNRDLNDLFRKDYLGPAGFPRGVTFNKSSKIKPYKAVVGLSYIGCYKTTFEAAVAHVKAKLRKVTPLVNKYQHDSRIVESLLRYSAALVKGLPS